MTPDPATTAAPLARRDAPVLLCGVGPLPVGNPDRLYAPGLRVWGFARALVTAGVPVHLLEAQFGGAAQGADARLHRLNDKDGAAVGETIDLEPAPPAELIRRALAEEPYRAVIATTDVMNDAAARAAGDLPLWCDFFGHPMAERQSLSTVYASDEGLAPQWDFLLAPLLRADRLSGCSEAQRMAIVGELGACGRLNRHTDGQPLVHRLAPAALLTEPRPSGRKVRGALFPDDAFAILWTGGYNTWADPDTLADGLIRAMQEEPRIHYVSTGGAIEGHDDRTFERFRARLRKSPAEDRCHFAGWVPTNEVPDFYLAADAAVNCDRVTLEGELGTRNRILDWVCAGLTVVSTPLCELARDLAARGLIDPFEAGDAAGLARRFVDVARRPEAERRERAARARKYLVEACDPAVLFRSMAEWGLAPHAAADLRPAMAPDVPFRHPDNALALRRVAEWRAAGRKGSSAATTGIVPRLVRRLSSLIGEKE